MKIRKSSLPGFFDGLIVALLISIGVGITSIALGGFLDNAERWILLVDLAALAYVIYLLRRSQARVGRLVVVAGWLALSVGCYLVQAPVFDVVLLQAGFVWLTRALYFHSRLGTAVLDLGLVSAGLAAAAWASVNTLSPTAAIWSFLLVQALFCWLPGLAGSSEPTQPYAPSSNFQSAHRAARDALRKINQP